MRRVIVSGKFTMGENVRRFERVFARRVGSKHCVMVNSGSSANLLMVAALFYRRKDRLERGDEVIVPAVSWSTTYAPLHQYGLKIKFVDIDPDTLNFDLAKLASAVTARTRAIFAVNLLGNPNDFDAIRRIIGRRSVLLLEDNCESLGAVFKGRQTGTFGLMGSFSSFFSHHISTMEGGMVATDDDELAQIVTCLRAHGWTRELPARNAVCGTKSADPFEESYRFVLPGYNLRPLELSGAIGVEQVKKLPRLIAARRRNAALFRELMREFPDFRIQEELGRSSWFGFSLVVRPGAPFSRAAALRALAEHGVETRPIVGGNFAKNEVVRWFDASVHGTLTAAEEIDRRGFFVGNHHYDLRRQFTLLKKALSRLPRR
ncbi:MAG: DegT/DnrJ/EryC1/StrS family aminotransferase [Elusimicrobia bacterium]|nr:DegT/DnrJ/EryC1/StrS family aminotransferase [Elusimicrobiota bacterium]